ncbi:MAG: 3'(2'),5'-bisphosphate nucleotidase CysQ [Terricaulis sp.]
MITPKLDDLIALARAAGREIMAVREEGFVAQTKGDGSLVTLADQRAEALIEEGLHRIAPGLPMLGEEAVASGRVPVLGQRFFCVDPLDGTRGFAKGGDEFTVNIALVIDGAPVQGVVYAPATGELYAGEPGRAVRALGDDALTTVASAAAPPNAIWRVIASEYSGRNEKTAHFIAALGAAAIHASSSIKLCRIAEGAADLYPRFGDVCQWDIAAGHAVLAAAGGDIMNLDGGPLHYGDDHGGFIVPGFVAFANAAAASAARSAL